MQTQAFVVQSQSPQVLALQGMGLAMCGLMGGVQSNTRDMYPDQVLVSHASLAFLRELAAQEGV